MPWKMEVIVPSTNQMKECSGSPPQKKMHLDHFLAKLSYAHYTHAYSEY